MHINDILKVAVERKASDVHLKVGAHPVLRMDGRLQVLTEFKRLMQEDTIAMAFSMMSSRQKERFKHNLETDIAYSVPGLGRFRCNIFQQRGSVGIGWLHQLSPILVMDVKYNRIQFDPVNTVQWRSYDADEITVGFRGQLSPVVTARFRVGWNETVPSWSRTPSSPKRISTPSSGWICSASVLASGGSLVNSRCGTSRKRTLISEIRLFIRLPARK